LVNLIPSSLLLQGKLVQYDWSLQAAFEEGEKIESIQHVYYGPSRDIAEIETALKLTGFGIETMDDPAGSAAKLLAQGCIIGWYQGSV